MLVEFYLIFWRLVSGDFLKIFQDFYDRVIDISRLNYDIVTLTAKGQGADKTDV